MGAHRPPLSGLAQVVVVALIEAGMAAATPAAPGAADATMAPTDGAVTGAVTETGPNTAIARAGVTDGSGAYSLNVVPGPYKIIFIDAAGLHNAEWHNNQPATNLAGATSVTAPAATNAALDRNTGSMSGTVTDDPSFDPVPGAWVLAIGPTGINGGAVTAANGTYAINNLPPGTYRVTFVDPNGGRTQEYWDNSPDFIGAGTLNVTAANNVNDVDGFIALP